MELERLKKQRQREDAQIEALKVNHDEPNEYQEVINTEVQEEDSGDNDNSETHKVSNDDSTFY